MWINWRSDLETGIAAVDADHREIIRRFNALLTACEQGRGRDEVKGLISYLENYAGTHFRDEEKLHEETGYPDAAVHREQHRTFTDKLRELNAKFSQQGTPVYLVVRTNRFLAEWLFDHIYEKDREFGDFLRKKKTAGRPEPGA
jgi:hemerythrin